MDEFPICAGIRARDERKYTFLEQINDWVATVGHLGRDGDLLLLLAVGSSCWTRRALGMGNQCPADDS